MAEAAQQASTEMTQWVTFKLGEETYGVNVHAGARSVTCFRDCTGSWCTNLCLGDYQFTRQCGERF